MRTTFLSIFFALVAHCATADQIDNVVTNLPDGWDDGASQLIIMPKTASTEDVLQRFYQENLFPDFDTTNVTTLKVRQVDIPCGHFPGAHVNSYTAVLVKKGRTEAVVLLRFFDAYTSRAWSCAVDFPTPSS